jgi:hypothetical protein
MAQQTKTKSRSGSGSRSNRRTSANGRTAAKSRSSASRSQTSRTPKRKASSSDQKGALDAAKDATTKGANAAGNAVTSTAKKLKTPLIATGTGLRESLRVLPSLKRTRGSPASTCRVAVLGAQRRRVSARRPRTSGCSPSGPGKLPNRCASQAKRSARAVRPASPSPPSRSSWRGLRVAGNQGLVDRELQ